MSVPETIAREVSEPTIIGQAIQRTAKRIGWLGGIAGAFLTVTVGVVASVGAINRLETKTAADGREARITAEIAKQADAAEAQSKRLGEVEMWRAAHSATETANSSWMRESLGRLLDERRLPRPPEPIVIAPAR